MNSTLARPTFRTDIRDVHENYDGDSSWFSPACLSG